MNDAVARGRLREMLKSVATGGPEPMSIGSEVVVYGAGSRGREVIHLVRQAGYRIAAVLDLRAEQIGSIHGIPCINPRDSAVAMFADRELPVIVGVFNPDADPLAILGNLQGKGFSRVISYYEFCELFSGEFEPVYWLRAPRLSYLQHEDDLAQALDVWGDDASRKVFLDLLELRLFGNFEHVSCPDTKHQYFPSDLPRHQEPMRFVDGGAFTGDTLQRFLAAGYVFEAVAAFEPQHENFSRLSEFVSSHSTTLPNAEIFRCGLGDANEDAAVTHEASASRITKGGGDTVSVVAFDQVLPSFNPTLVKLDVEGYEARALAGASQSIRRCQPSVAVCIYHEPHHLWTLPKMLKRMLPNHSLALRYHGFNGFDSVAYAVPAEG